MIKRKEAVNIIKIVLIIVCACGIAWIAVYTFNDEHKITNVLKNINQDFNAYGTIDELIAEGIIYLDKALEQTDRGKTDFTVVKNYGNALAFFSEVLKRKKLNPDALAYTGIIKGMLADLEADVMLKITLINEAFRALDQAISIKEDFYYASYWSGIFSVEVPNTIFNRLQRGLVELEKVLENKEKCDFLSDDYYFTLIYSIGKAKKLSGDSTWKKYIDEVLASSTIQDLLESSASLLK